MQRLPDGLSYFPEFLTTEAQHELVQQLATLPFEHDSFRGQQLKRSYAQFGYAYVSTGRKLLPATPFPNFLTELIEKTKPHTPAGAFFNQSIITLYPKGAGIGWHADAEHFGDVIIAISLAGAARLEFRTSGTVAPTHQMIAEPGSLYVMTGPARWQYQHQVIPVKTDRYSITLRQCCLITRNNHV